MKLEQQVCSLDLAKRLKELEVKQESLFRWWKDQHGNYVVLLAEDAKTTGISAFTVAELGEMLPSCTLKPVKRIHIRKRKEDSKWEHAYLPSIVPLTLSNRSLK